MYFRAPPTTNTCHVEEYLGVESTPAPLRGAIDVAAHVSFGAKVTASQARRNLTHMADTKFILGTTTEEHEGTRGLGTRQRLPHHRSPG